MDKIKTRVYFGGIMRGKMQEMNLSPAELEAELTQRRSSLRVQTLYGYLRGTNFPHRREDLEALCDVLKIPLENLDLVSLVARKYYGTMGVVLPSDPPPLVPEAHYSGFEIGNGEMIVGVSAPMLRLFSQLEIIVQNPNQEAPLFIMGESGTGKELVAKAIHFNSLRREKPFVGINITSVSESLLESELFGHRKGAFTGAITEGEGLFESVGEGTLLLDEIGSLPKNVQVKLLRVLQEREFYRIGDSKPRPFRGRIVAATKEDLAAKMRSGSFREDLYYRLDVVRISLVPLRERKTDIVPLFRYIIEEYNRKFATSYSFQMREDDYELLQNYHFPGNVREFQNFITKAIFANPASEVISLAPFVEDQLPFSEDILRQRFIDETILRINGSVSSAKRLRLQGLLAVYYDVHGDFNALAEMVQRPRQAIKNCFLRAGLGARELQAMYLMTTRQAEYS